jgi:hypothetical protein
MQEEHGGDVQESLQLAKRGTRFLGVNMLSELDHPEEYYILDITWMRWCEQGAPSLKHRSPSYPPAPFWKCPPFSGDQL